MWQIYNLIADNDALAPMSRMVMSAAWLTLYNPVDKTSVTVIPPPVVVDYMAPDIGGPPLPGDEVWAYFIYSHTLGIKSANSKRGPMLGPVMPLGFTHYAPAFPVILTSSGVQPISPYSGPSNIHVVDNGVFYRTPLLIYPDAGVQSYPAANFTSLKTYVPSMAKTLNLQLNPELHDSSGTQIIAGAVASTGGSNFANISLYPKAGWAAGDMTTYFPLKDRDLRITFMVSSGAPDLSLCDVFILGYTF